MIEKLVLPFGNGWATRQVSDDQLLAQFHRRNRPIRDVSFQSGRSQSAFTADLKIGQLSLISVSSDPVSIRVAADDKLSMILLTQGSVVVHDGDRTMKWSANGQFLRTSPGRSFDVDYTRASFVTIRPDFEHLKHEFEKQVPSTARLEERLSNDPTSVFRSNVASHDYSVTLLRLLKMADHCGGHEAFLARIGFDRTITKLLASIIISHYEYGALRRARLGAPQQLRAIDVVCDHVKDAVGTPLTDCDMENLSGLSLQELNMAFRSRFDCSAQQWQRNYLLDEARKLLIAVDQDTPSELVWFELGFSSRHSFCNSYKKRFGELPSDTRSRCRRH